MKIEDIIRCTGINPFYVNSDSQRKALAEVHKIDAYTGGIANAYVYIPYSKEIEKISNLNSDMYPFECCRVHGGVTYGSVVEGIPPQFHCPYSKVLTEEEWTAKYIVVGWDTNHYNDTPDKWTYKTLIEENEQLANQILEIINKELK